MEIDLNKPWSYSEDLLKNRQDGARLDISARSFWSPLDRAFTDVRVLHPQAQSNSDKSISQIYQSHEKNKKREYNDRVLNVEKATFTPLVFSTTGGMALEALQFLKHLAEKISLKKGQRYSDVMSFVRRRLCFDLLRTCIISIRGYRGTRTLPPTALSDLDLNLINTPKSWKVMECLLDEGLNSFLLWCEFVVHF